MTIEELIETLKKAEGPSRELDRSIGFDVLGWQTVEHRAATNWDSDWAETVGADGVPLEVFPKFTKSIDDALGLLSRILPGWHWHIGSCPSDFLTHVDQPFSAELMGPVTYAVIDREIGEEPIYETAGASAPSAPLALVLAILKALKAKQVQP